MDQPFIPGGVHTKCLEHGPEAVAQVQGKGYKGCDVKEGDKKRVEKGCNCFTNLAVIPKRDCRGVENDKEQDKKPAEDHG